MLEVEWERARVGGTTAVPTTAGDGDVAAATGVSPRAPAPRALSRVKDVSADAAAADGVAAALAPVDGVLPDCAAGRAATTGKAIDVGAVAAAVRVIFPSPFPSPLAAGVCFQ